MMTLEPRHLGPPSLKLLFDLALDVAPPQELGQTPAGRRRIIAIEGGSFHGPRLRGRVRAGDGDWIVVRADGTVIQDVRLVLEVDDGELVGVTYRGVRHGPQEVIDRLSRGEEADPGSYTFVNSPVFETRDDGPHSWLNRVVAVSNGHRVPGGVLYSTYIMS